jgi:lysophospholipase L1-like esterase
LTAVRGVRAGVFLGLLVAQGCSESATQPTPPSSDPPTISCPSPVTLPSLTGQPINVVYGTATATGGTSPVTIACVPPSGSIFPVGSTVVTCTATDQAQRTSSCAFNVNVTAPPRLSVTRFLAFGDSITWGEDGRNSAMSLGPSTRVRPAVQFATPDTYPGALEIKLAGLYTAQTPKVQNGGWQGEHVTDPTTFPRFVSFTSSGDYDVVLLMEGANDLPDSDVPDVIAGLGRMIDDAKSRRMQVFLATLPPEDPAGNDPIPRGGAAPLVAPFNDHVRALAASKGIPLVDVYQAFGGDLSLIGADGLHPTAAGYHRIADTFLASIRATLELVTTSSNQAPLLPRFAPPRRR